MNKRIELYVLLAGLVFLVSGIAKSLDMAAFVNVAVQYGFSDLSVVLPFVVLAEVLVGLLLVFRLWQKSASLAGAIMVTGFTLLYVYGVIFQGVEDCGCFGTISVLNTSPVFTLLRNAVLLYLLAAVWRKGENNANFNKWIAVVMLAFMSLAAFMSGYSFRKAAKNKTKDYQVEAIQDTALKDFITTSPDSTYLVFAFSYTCPHCLNSIANLKEYETAGVVDKVIGLALNDSIAEKKFVENFRPNFMIINHSAANLFRLTNLFPTAYYIENDSIFAEISGTLPCSYLFKQIIIKI